MAKQETGIKVVDQWEKLGHTSCKHWLFRVWDKHRRSYASEAFEELAPGWEWALNKRAELTLGVSTSGRALLKSIASEYLERSNADKFHRAEMGRIVDAVIANGAVDMLSDSFGSLAYQWLKTAKPFGKYRTLPLSPVTRNRWFNHLRSIVKYARDSGKITRNPFFGFDSFTVEDKNKSAFRLDEMKRLVSDEFRDDPYFLRFCLLIYTGRRIQEAQHSRWEWHDWEGRQIEVRSHPEYKIKKKKERFIPMQPEYFDIFYPLRKESGWIIEDKAMRNAKDKDSWCQFRGYLKRVGIINKLNYDLAKTLKKSAETGEMETIRRLSPHSTRHSYIALRLASGESVTQVRREAGHSDVETTDEYAEAEASYRNSVKDWPRGTFCLRKSADEHRGPTKPEQAKAPEIQRAPNIIQFIAPARAALAQPRAEVPAFDQ